MLVKKMTRLLVGSVAIFSTSALLADGPKIGLQYRAGLTYDDGGFEDTKNVDAKASSTLAVEHANITAMGEAASNVMVTGIYSMAANELIKANARLQLHDMVGVTIGQDKVAQGGWFHKEFYAEYTDIHSDAGWAWARGDNPMATKPFSTFEPMIALHVALAGELNVQLVNDVVTQAEEKDDSGNVTQMANGYKNRRNSGPAGVIEWQGDFMGWMPLVQVSTYDLNKSTMYSLGIKGKAAGVGIMVNYLVDSRKEFPSGTNDENTHTMTKIDAELSYSLGSWTPFIGFHQFDREQDGTDLKVNSTARTFDDNAQSFEVGVNCNAPGPGYVPYLAVISDSSDVQDPSDTTKEETRTNLTVKAGVFGQF